MCLKAGDIIPGSDAAHLHADISENILMHTAGLHHDGDAMGAAYHAVSRHRLMPLTAEPDAGVPAAGVIAFDESAAAFGEDAGTLHI